MKKIILTTLALVSSLTLFAQNTFLNNGGEFDWVGIGTTEPKARLHIQNGEYGIRSIYGTTILENKDVQLDLISSPDQTWGSTINFIEGNGDSNTDVWSISRQTTKGTGNSSLRFKFGTANSHINPTKVVFGANGYVGIGTLNPDSKLTVKGKIHCEEIQVDLQVPADYVFEKYYTGVSELKESYTMPSLEEVEAYTKENHHLPNIPSASKIKEEGLHLKEMTNLLLQKIEELTLYTIEQEKRIKVLEGKLTKGE